MNFEPLQNKYTKWYFNIINNRLMNPIDGYIERHHIHPESLGGSNAKENIVALTAREHYICHLLLTRMLTGKAKKSMHFAFYSMQRKKEGMERYVPNSHIYEIVRKKIDRTPSDETRKKMSEAQKNRPPLSDEGRENLSKSVKASYTPELRQKRSEQFKGRVFSEETLAKMSVSKTGVKRSEESRKKQGDSIRGENNHNARCWVLLTPDNQIIRVLNMTEFCEQNNLNYFSLRNRAYFKDRRPISRGPSKGWSVLGY